MKHSTTLALAALLAPAALAQSGSEAREAQDQAQYVFGKLRDHMGAGVQFEEPPVIIDYWRDQSNSYAGENEGDSSDPDGTDARDVRVDLPEPPDDGLDWAVVEGEFEAAGANLAAGADAGAPVSAEELREVVKKYEFATKDLALFADLEDIEPPIVIDRGWGRDLWARTVEVGLLRRIQKLRDAMEAGTATPEQFSAVRERLLRRAQILEESSDTPTQALEAMLTEAEGTRNPADLERFRLALTARRALQAARIAQARQTAMGVRLSDRERFGKLVEHYREIRRQGNKIRTEPGG